MTYDSRQILQLFIIALCADSQLPNRKITNIVLHVSLHLKPYADMKANE